MKKRVQKRGRSYRLLGSMTVLSVLVSLLLGFLVSEDACLLTFFAGATAITFGAILSFGIESAAEIRREKTEAANVASVPRKIPKRS